MEEDEQIGGKSTCVGPLGLFLHNCLNVVIVLDPWDRIVVWVCFLTHFSPLTVPVSVLYIVRGGGGGGGGCCQRGQL